jgi:hypothetical protein
MDSEQYHQAAKSAADLVDKGDYVAALEVLRSLVESDLPDLDRSVMAVNMATVCDKMGQVPDALGWYDYGIALEYPLMRCFVTERKAEYLIGKGRKAEAVAVYETLLPEPFLTLGERERIRQNVAILRQ